MMKVFLGFALLLAAVFAHAEDLDITLKNAAITAALADSVTTKLVLHTGGFERNPLVTATTTGLVALAALKWGSWRQLMPQDLALNTSKLLWSA